MKTIITAMLIATALVLPDYCAGQAPAPSRPGQPPAPVQAVRPIPPRGIRIPSQPQQPQDSDEPASAAKPAASPLTIHQEAVRQMTREMEHKFGRLAEALKASEPEQAARLLEALRNSKESLLEQRMSEVGKLIEGGRLDEARKAQDKIVDDLIRLMDVLTANSEPKDDLLERIRELEKRKKEVGDLANKERGAQRDSETASDRNAALAALDAAAKNIEGIIAKQEKLSARTATGKVGDLPNQTAEQKAIRDATEQASGGKDVPEPGQAALREAAARQKQVEKDLDRGARHNAQANQQAATDQLKKALDEIGRERARIAALPADHSDQLADKQDQIAGEADKLSRSMEQPGKDKSGKPGQSGTPEDSGKPGSGKPGDENDEGNQETGKKGVQKAQKSMEQASGEHRKKSPKTAAEKQKKAVKELEEAQKEIDKALAQLRQQEREEMLAALEVRFREILTRHQPIAAATCDLEKARTTREWTRAHRLRLIDAAKEEQALADLVQQTLEIIQEDGTTVIFPNIVRQLRDDMRNVNHLLGQEQTGVFTQSVEHDIEQTLKELIAALEKAQKQEEQKQQDQKPSKDQPSQDKPQPLVPDSAELKLLRSAQVRTNERTRSFDLSRTASELGPEDKIQVQKITARQADVSAMAEKMIERAKNSGPK